MCVASAVGLQRVHRRPPQSGGCSSWEPQLAGCAVPERTWQAAGSQRRQWGRPQRSVELMLPAAAAATCLLACNPIGSSRVTPSTSTSTHAASSPDRQVHRRGQCPPSCRPSCCSLARSGCSSPQVVGAGPVKQQGCQGDGHSSRNAGLPGVKPPLALPPCRTLLACVRAPANTSSSLHLPAGLCLWALAHRRQRGVCDLAALLCVCQPEAGRPGARARVAQARRPPLCGAVGRRGGGLVVSGQWEGGRRERKTWQGRKQVCS